jgi:hypothetical protein
MRFCADCFLTGRADLSGRLAASRSIRSMLRIFRGWAAHATGRVARSAALQGYCPSFVETLLTFLAEAARHWRIGHLARHLLRFADSRPIRGLVVLWGVGDDSLFGPDRAALRRRRPRGRGCRRQRNHPPRSRAKNRPPLQRQDAQRGFARRTGCRGLERIR